MAMGPPQRGQGKRRRLFVLVGYDHRRWHGEKLADAREVGGHNYDSCDVFFSKLAAVMSS